MELTLPAERGQEHGAAVGTLQAEWTMHLTLDRQSRHSFFLVLRNPLLKALQSLLIES